MISGIKISQLNAVDSLLSTDYLPIARGSNTRRIDGLAIYNSISGSNDLGGTGIYKNNYNGILNFKSLTAVGDILTLVETASTIVLSAEIPANSITNEMLQPISSLCAVNISAIDTLQSLSGQVLMSIGPGVPPVWITLPIESYSTNVSDSLISRDSNGNFYANIVIADLSGNASTATKWLTSRSVTLTGAVLGNTTLDGSQPVTIITSLSTGIITNQNIADNASISDTKLSTINTPNKVSINAIDPGDSEIGQTLTSTGSSTPPVWQTPPLVNTANLVDEAITTAKLADSSVTLTKTTATSANTINSIVARNQFGEFAATAIYGNLQGNAFTSTKWQTPRQIAFEGAITGVFALDGSTNVTVPVVGKNLASAWVSFNGTQTEAVSCQYTQTTATNILTINTPILEEVISLTGIYTQGNFSIPSDIAEITLLSGTLIDDNIFLNEYLLGGTLVSLTFLSGASLDSEVPFLNNTNGSYVIQAGVPLGQYFTVKVNNTQVVSGEVIAEFLKTTPAFALNHLSGHVISLDFIDGINLETETPLTGGNLNSNGLYTVLSSISSNVIEVSSTLIQESSGNVNIIRNTLNSVSNIVSVTPKGVGNYLLNIYPALSTSNYFYTGSVRASSDELCIGSIITLLNDIKTNNSLEIRTVLNNGSINYFDSTETNILIYG